MKAWKWITLGILVFATYLTAFIWIWGWILSICFALAIFILLILPYGGNAKEAYKKYKVNQLEALENDKKNKLSEERLNDETELSLAKAEGKEIEVAVGLSGGVDSAVSAYLLKKQGYKVTAFYMRNWNRRLNDELNNIPDDPADCVNQTDYEDAKKIAAHLGIELVYINFVKDYWNLVFTPFLEDLKNGITPNPDILCNSKIKFNKFFDYIRTNYPNIKYIATGHYASIKKEDDKFYLAQCKDEWKDQTYFLAEINKDVLHMLKFPVAELKKEEVRKIAKEAGIPVFDKPDSMGICFIGDRKFDKFIENWIKPIPGDIIDIKTNKVIDKHKGIMFYTIGQRKGVTKGGFEKPYFVVKKDSKNNILYVSNDVDDNSLWNKTIKANRVNWLIERPIKVGTEVEIKIRHSNIKYLAKVITSNSNEVEVEPNEILKTVTPGQELVLYRNGICLGGGQIIE